MPRGSRHDPAGNIKDLSGAPRCCRCPCPGARGTTLRGILQVYLVLLDAAAAHAQGLEARPCGDITGLSGAPRCCRCPCPGARGTTLRGYYRFIWCSSMLPLPMPRGSRHDPAGILQVYLVLLDAAAAHAQGLEARPCGEY